MKLQHLSDLINQAMSILHETQSEYDKNMTFLVQAYMTSVY